MSASQRIVLSDRPPHMLSVIRHARAVELGHLPDLTSADEVLSEGRVAVSGGPGDTCRMENAQRYRWSYGSVPLNDDEWHVVEMEGDGNERQALCGFPIDLEKQGARWGSPDTFPRHDECTDIYNSVHPDDPLATRLA
jgi:hypothetical protein